MSGATHSYAPILQPRRNRQFLSRAQIVVASLYLDVGDIVGTHLINFIDFYILQHMGAVWEFCAQGNDGDDVCVMLQGLHQPLAFLRSYL